MYVYMYVYIYIYIHINVYIYTYKQIYVTRHLDACEVDAEEGGAGG